MLQANSLYTDTRGVNVNNITVTYKNGHTAVFNASFKLPKGSITALLGVNGAGKSTIFKALMGLVTPQQGQVDLLDLNTKQALKNNLISYVPQSEEVDWSFPVLVEDVVMMGRYGHMGFLRRPRRADKIAVADALDRVSMQEYANRQIGELSGGQKKRVFLARALAQNGQILLLDEPFTGVDAGTEKHIIQLLLELKSQGRIVLVSTHNLNTVPQFCDRAVLVKKTIVASGSLKQTLTTENLDATFGGLGALGKALQDKS